MPTYFSSAQMTLETLLFDELPKIEPESEPEALLSNALLPVFRIQLVREGERPFSGRAEISSPEEAAHLFSEYLADKDRECVVALMLDTKNRMIGLNEVAVGTLNMALISPREVFKPAILCNAANVIVCHNHPSGDPEPSPEDIAVTQRLFEAGKHLDIGVLDHLVIGDEGRFCSLKQRGCL